MCVEREVRNHSKDARNYMHAALHAIARQRLRASPPGYSAPHTSTVCAF